MATGFVKLWRPHGRRTGLTVTATFQSVAIEVEQQKPSYPIASVDSALRLLMLLSERDQVRVVDAASDLGVARSTAHRLLQMLVYYGFATQERESRAYAAGPRLMGLGLQLVRRLHIRDIATPYMAALVAEVHETVILQALQGESTVLCLHSIESEQALRVTSRTGVVLEAAASAGGQAILSTMPDERVLEIYPEDEIRCPADDTPKLRTDLLDNLSQTRSRGYSAQQNESELGVSAISSPVRLGADVATFALTVALPTARATPRATRAIGASLVEHAAQLALALGL